MAYRATLDSIESRLVAAIHSMGEATRRHDWEGVVLLQAWVEHLRREWDVEHFRKPRSCNRHTDCDDAEAREEKRTNAPILAGFHCHDDECPDCFGY